MSSRRSLRLAPGHRYPPGATQNDHGVNFCVFSRYATKMELILYESPQAKRPFATIGLDPDINRTFFFWHVFVEGIGPGVAYTWRADGPRECNHSGLRFHPGRELLDPWARAVCDLFWDRPLACLNGQGPWPSMRAVVPETPSYDWEGDTPLVVPPEEEIIYELHVGGFTKHPSSGVSTPGTFKGLIEKIPYLKSLGITAVELMPIMAFDAQDVPERVRQKGLKNFWGYSTHSFFAPHAAYFSDPLAAHRLDELKDMVKALHRAGIAVIMDVVLNHTAEGADDGPIINFKGLFNEIFYHLDPSDRCKYVDYTGCGNTVNCNHPLVTRFIIDCLEYWVREFHIDGFRFDLASVLVRGEDGTPMHHAPTVWAIEFSDELINSRLIAEAWDASGLYQVGSFPGFRWAEWNGRFRDVMRQFVRGDKGLVGEVATRIAGSSDLYEAAGRPPTSSINFITCHDGFTLWDLVSYNQKHNEANGEDNQDGTNENFSWNCGVEGPTDDPSILDLRRKQAKNLISLLFLSQGVPMILAGDEVLRTQHGNNNTWCQDNELGWFDWRLMEENHDMLRFTREIIAFRKRHPTLRRNRYLTGRPDEIRGLRDISWHGTRLHSPPWDNKDARHLAFTLAALKREEEDLHVILNMESDGLRFEVPVIPGREWYLAISTANPSPWDIVRPESQSTVGGPYVLVPARSIMVLEAR